MRKIMVAFIALTAGALSLDAWACGDSLYRVGKGVSYRVYTAPLPGNVLIYGQTQGAEALAKALSDSGHNVRLVEGEVELEVELVSNEYDVVIATYDNHEQIESTVGRNQGPAFLPVALNAKEAQIAKQSYNRVMLADKDEIKSYLKAIHKTLKSKT